MKKLLVILLAVSSAFAMAQGPVRIRGTISSVDGNRLVVDDKTQVVIDDKTEIVVTQPIALADIRPGDFLALSSRTAADGRLTAYEVRRFPKPLNPGHRELTMAYDGGVALRIQVSPPR